MKKDVARRVLGAVLLVAVAVGSLGAVATAVADSCERECLRAYRQCVPFCSKNPCFVACETVLEICLSNCGPTS